MKMHILKGNKEVYAVKCINILKIYLWFLGNYSEDECEFWLSISFITRFPKYKKREGDFYLRKGGFALY